VITETGLAESQSWEQLAVGGRIIIDAIFHAIDKSDLAAFDISTLNENVLLNWVTQSVAASVCGSC
jgi:hypothetical protein